MSTFEASTVPCTVTARFEQMVAAYPTQWALQTVQERWSYADLNRCANQIAHRLVAEKLTWTNTITPLEQFVRNPVNRPDRQARYRIDNHAPAVTSKSVGQLVDEALYHYRHGGARGLFQETYGFVRRRMKG